MKRKIKPIKSKLSAAEIQRAIYIDYEGNMHAAPTLLGWRVDGQNHAAIVESGFADCAGRYRAKQVTEKPHEVLIRELVLQAQTEGRRIVSWSEHDYNMMHDAVGDADRLQIRQVFRNALNTARPWHRRTRGATPPDKASLSYFCDILYFPVPEKYGLGLVGESLKTIREQLSQGRKYADLSPGARSRWVRVVKHNQLDLEGMEHVLKTMAA